MDSKLDINRKRRKPRVMDPLLNSRAIRKKLIKANVNKK